MLHTVAKLHYEADLSQVEIARQLGLSTATVSRMLRRARAEGIVRIEVRDPLVPHGLGARLTEAFGLKLAAVVDRPPDGALATLSAPLSQTLRDSGLGAGSVLALGWGRTIRAVLEAGLPALPGVEVVPATGGLQQPAPHFQISEFVRAAAGQLQGRPHFLHAPYLPSAEARASFLADPAIRETVALWNSIDVLVVGVGLPHAINPLEATVATPAERALTTAQGDVLRHYFDADGRLIPWDGEESLVALSVAQLRKVPLSIAVAADEAKAVSLVGAIRARLVNAVVTDARTANAMLALAGPRPRD